MNINVTNIILRLIKYNLSIKDLNLKDEEISSILNQTNDIIILKFFRYHLKSNIEILKFIDFKINKLYPYQDLNNYKNTISFFDPNDKNFFREIYPIVDHSNKNKILFKDISTYRGHLIDLKGYHVIDRYSNPTIMPFVSGLHPFVELWGEYVSIIREKYYKKEIKFFSTEKLAFTFGKNYLNIFHCVVEYLPKVEKLYNDGFRNFIIPRDLPVAIQDLLKLIYKDINFIIIDNEKTYKFKNLTTYYGINTFDDSLLNSFNSTNNFDINELHEIANKIKNFDKIFQLYKGKKIYLRRRKTRQPIFEKVFCYLLRIFNFKIIHPENLNFVEQISIFLNSKVIVGVAGAAFAWSFLSKNTVIFNIISSTNRNYNGIKRLTAVNNAKYIKLLGTDIFVKPFTKSNYLNQMHGSFFINPFKFIFKIIKHG